MRINRYILVVSITIVLFISACNDQSHIEVLEIEHSAYLLKTEEGGLNKHGYSTHNAGLHIRASGVEPMIVTIE